MRVLMPPSPVFPLSLTPLAAQVTILPVLFPQITAVGVIFFLVIHMVVAAVPIVVPLVVVLMVVVVGLHGRDWEKEGGAQRECTQVTFHVYYSN